LSNANLSGADLRDTNLSSANFSGANFRDADLRYANLSNADLRGTDLRGANFRDADLRYANLSNANLSGADLRGANLSNANFNGANLSDADLSGANLSNANLSDATGLLDPLVFLKENFEETRDGFVVYKTFNSEFKSPTMWIIAEKSVIKEIVNYDRCCGCACGINFATLKWIENNSKQQEIWKCLLTWESLATLCVPYNTDGKARCGQLVLIEKI
jgi:hypothetical protein